MEDFSHAGKKDMHFMYGHASGNARAALQIYQEQFPHKPIPVHIIFQWLTSNIVSEFLSASPDTNLVAVRSACLEKSILNLAADRPESSTSCT